MTPAAIERAALSDPDARPLTRADTKRMKRTPQAKIICRALRITQEAFTARFHILLAALFFFSAFHVHAQAGTVFQGQVLDRVDQSMSGADVKLKSADQLFESYTDGRGNFKIVAPPGAYELTVSRDGFKDRVIKRFIISQTPRKETFYLDLGPVMWDSVTPIENAKKSQVEPPKPTERVQGSVMNEFGTLIGNASLTLSSPKKTLHSKSDSKGLFKFNHAPAGTYSLTISADGFQTKTIEDVKSTRQDSTYLEITLDAADHP